MGSKKANLLGQRFQKLVVIEKGGTDKSGKPLWICECDCGNKTTSVTARLTIGKKRSCGCVWKKEVSQRFKKHGHTSNGLIGVEYMAWHSMKERCLNPNTDGYENYGGRGITVCERWLDAENGFQNFYDDMGDRPSPKHSLDRFPDKDGHYEPNNCRWATQIQQARNKTTNVVVEYEGERLVIIELANRFGVDPRRLGEQIKIKSPEEAIFFLLHVRKPGRKSGKENVNSRKIGSFGNGILVKEYIPMGEVTKDGFGEWGVRNALKTGKPYKDFNWKYLDEPNKKVA
jgi:hypothetical protein